MATALVCPNFLPFCLPFVGNLEVLIYLIETYDYSSCMPKFFAFLCLPIVGNLELLMYLIETYGYQIDFLFVVNVGFPVLPLFKTISF